MKKLHIFLVALFQLFSISLMANSAQMMCNATYTTSGLELTVENISAPILSVKVFELNFQQIQGCDPWSTPCNDPQTFTLPQAGSYYLQIQSFNDWSSPAICDIFETITVVADACATAGGDADGDGICADLDCDDTDAAVGEVGDSCDDGDATTQNDVLQADCSCAGEIPCANNGGDADGDGICADVDCDDNDATIGQAGDACDDGDANTSNDILQADCTCAGILPPCFNNGGDADGDGVCANSDCDDNDAAISAAGDSCDDGDATTENDVIQSDCSCAGTPIPPGGCQTTYSLNGLELTIQPINLPINTIKVLLPNFSPIFECDPWTTPCNSAEVITLPAEGDYYVQINTQENWSTPVCSIFELITATAAGCDDIDGDGVCADIDCDDNDPAVSNEGDACDDGDAATENDVILADCSCAGTLIPCVNEGGDTDGDGVCDDIDCDINDPLISQPGDACDDGDSTTTNDIIVMDCSCQGNPPCQNEGGDADGDGICADVDCDDNDPLISVEGDLCDDGDSTTVNDIILADCSCAGTAPPCINNGGDADGDGICADVDCDDNDPLISIAGDLCDDGDSTTVNDVILADCSCAGELPCANNGGDADGDGVCADMDCDDNDPLISVEGDLCDDGDSTTINDVILADCSCAGTLPPCFNEGGDADGDGVCADMDCDDNDPLISVEGDLCDDGDSTTINDIILTDCSCAGEPDDPTICDATYSITGNVVTINNVVGTFKSVKILDINFGADFTCDDFTTVCDEDLVITVSGFGQYYVQIQTFIDWNTPVCNIFDVVIIEDPNMGGPCDLNGGDADGDGFCADVDCDDNDPAIKQPGDACDDGDPNTTNDIIINGCICQGTNPNACALSGGDVDGDGICGDDDCDPTDAGIGAPGEPCDDLNPNTENDIRQTDCTCSGTPIATTDSCDVTFTVVGNMVTITNLDKPIHSVQILDVNFGLEYACNSWDLPCDATITRPINAPGTYYLQIQTYTDWNSPAICDLFEQIQITDMDPCLNNGGDADNDGVCADVDCDDNNSLIDSPGDACNDGDPTTENDVIQADCSCAGTPCDNITDGGTISGDETLCPIDTPTPITSDVLPSGGSGAVEYQWLMSTQGCPISITDGIPGANQSTYSPGSVSETTYFRRLSRRIGCGDWMSGESNCVVKTIDSNCDPIDNCTATYSIDGNTVTIPTPNFPIVSIKILDAATFAQVYGCDLFSTPCDGDVVETLTAGNYYIQIQTFETWAAIECDIFDLITINSARLGNESNNFIEEKTELQLDKEYAKPLIFPNPAQSTINVALSDYIGKDVEIQIIDQLGKRQGIISINRLSENVISIPLNHLKGGIYSLQILSKGIKPSVQRFMLND